MKSTDQFERNTLIWLNYKFSMATLQEIADAFGLSRERIRQIWARRDREVESALMFAYLGASKPPTDRQMKRLETLYGIRIVCDLDWYGRGQFRMFLEDQEKINSLIKGKKELEGKNNG